MNKRMLELTMIGLVAIFAAPARAQPPRRPPPEAFAACADQDEGSLCTFEGRRGALEGTCRTPRGQRLVCVPNDHPGPPRGR